MRPAKFWPLAVACLNLPACAVTPEPPPAVADAQLGTGAGKQEAATDLAAAMPKLPADQSFQPFQAFASRYVAALWGLAPHPPPTTDDNPGSIAIQQTFSSYGRYQGEQVEGAFFKGRYNRSRARLPGNVEKWRAEPDIDNPGPDLANFPNSAFTLPQGRAYIELSPFTFYGSAAGSPPQYNAEFLLRYGLTDDIELRLFSNGPSWMGGSDSTWGFSPIAFDTKIQLWTEKPDWFMPAAGFEAYLQTEWLGNQAFNGGTQPSFNFNFDQSLPWGIDFEYNLGATRFLDADGKNVWEFSFQWALQRDLFNEDFAVFVHGFYNAASLPRVPNISMSSGEPGSLAQNAVGAGWIWSPGKRLAIYGQVSGGTTRFTPSIISMLGFALAF